MTAELLQNLIPSVNKSVQQSTVTKQTVADIEIGDFSTALDEAKAKYNFKEEISSKDVHVSDKSVKTKVSENIDTEASKELNPSSEKVDETNTVLDDENSDVKTEEVKSVESDKNKKLSENILNNIILGNKILGKEDKNNDGVVQTEQKSDVDINIEDSMLQVLTSVQENEKETQYFEDVEVQNEDIQLKEVDIDNLDVNIPDTEVKNGVVKNILNSEKSSIQILDNANLTIRENSSLMLNESQFIESNTTESEAVFTEIEQSDEAVIKVDDLIENSIDEFASETQVKNETENTISKFSQEIIDELDATINSVSSSDKQKMMNQQGQSFSNFNNNQNNAQETIIKMSIESSSENSSTVEFANINLNNSIDGNELLLNKAIDNVVKPQVASATPQQTLSDTEILAQINNKLTLPQDNTSNKVNIILQPEQLGKISVEIVQTKDGIVAKMVADTVQVKDLLDKSIESLKNNLASQGVNVNNITVKVEESSAAQNSNLGFEQEQFNREAANQSNQSNQQRHSNNSEALNNSNQNSEKNTSENIESTTETTDLDKEKINENGSISIMV